MPDDEIENLDFEFEEIEAVEAECSCILCVLRHILEGPVVLDYDLWCDLRIGNECPDLN